MSITYRQLKTTFRDSEGLFQERFCGSRRLAAISVLAHAKNDNGWPLAMLRVLQPPLARGLEAWTAKDFGVIRSEQETGVATVGTLAYDLESTFEELPLWPGAATHVSKDKGWLHRLPNGVLELQSFMGCCAPGYSFAYVQSPQTILSFTGLRTARLVGALTKENMEREVLLPNRARFLVVSTDMATRTIHLIEQDAT